jgi:hypothetical protein
MKKRAVAVVTVSRVVLLIDVILIILAAFGVTFSAVSAFELGVAVCFASFLVRVAGRQTAPCGSWQIPALPAAIHAAVVKQSRVHARRRGACQAGRRSDRQLRCRSTHLRERRPGGICGPSVDYSRTWNSNEASPRAPT